MARYFSFPLLLMALLMISTVIPSVSSKNTSLDKKKPKDAYRKIQKISSRAKKNENLKVRIDSYFHSFTFF
ncbi:hypothetical protein V3C99_005643 [Haemonchus contortus]